MPGHSGKYVWLLSVLILVLAGNAVGDGEDSGANFAGGNGSGAAFDIEVCTFNVIRHGTVMSIR